MLLNNVFYMAITKSSNSSNGSNVTTFSNAVVGITKSSNAITKSSNETIKTVGSCKINQV